MTAIVTPIKKSANQFIKYNLRWPNTVDPLSVEMDMIRRGGQWTKPNGETAGEGLAFHYRKFQEIAWPDKVWQKGPFVNHWAEKCLEVYLGNTYIGVMGCAAAGKSDSFGGNVLTDWYCHSHCTTVLVSSTDLKSLEIRIWGMIKKYHKEAKRLHNWLPGHLIEGKQMLILDPRIEAADGRDFKNGIIAVACKRGNQYVGLGPLIGIHNKRVRLLADECNLMPRAFLDSAANLSKCEDFKLVGLGNPNETTNAHGALCEPHVDLGGWEGGVDQQPGTKTWETRFPRGICLQLPGSDSPNLKAPEDVPPPFPFLITRQQMQDDAAIWGVDDWHYTMMNEAKMPRGQGSRRVLTRQMCQKFKAFAEPNWRDSRRKRIGFLDAAYRGVGGDRCVFGEIQFGPECEPLESTTPVTAILSQNTNMDKMRNIISLIDVMVVPISAEKGSDTPEDQIVRFVMNQCSARGIQPQDFFFDSGMRTSLVTAFSRLWDTGVNPIDCGGRPSETNVSSEIQVPCRDYYYKFITEIWFSVRLVVESGQFRGMTDEVCTEFSQREWKMTQGNKIEVESKEDMKLKCFVAGTMISTPTGDVAIESLRTGDLVNTPFGASPVVLSHENETELNLVRIEMESGEILVGTADHKVFTWDCGWCEMRRLSLHSKVEHVSRLWLWKIANAFFTRTTSTTFKHLVDTISAAGTKKIRGRSAFYTGLFGLTTLARFLKENAFITLTETGKTTASTIFGWLTGRATQATTLKSGGEAPNLEGEEWNQFQTLCQNPSGGTDLAKGGTGIEKTAKGIGSEEKKSNLFAVSASPGSAPTTPMQSFAQSGVRTAFTQNLTTMLRQLARRAANLFSAIATPSRKTALRSVLLLPCGNPVKVYNLTLLEHNAYYANGILVANCGRSPDLADAVAIGVLGARMRGFIISKMSSLQKDRKKGPDWRDQLKKRARSLHGSGLLNHSA